MITSTFPTVCADSVPDTAAFYRDLLGFEPVFVADWYVQLQAPDEPLTQIGVVARDHDSVPPEQRRAPAGVLLGVEVDDVDSVHARVVAAGHPIIRSLRDEDWGQRHFITLDPAGAMVDVITPIAPTTDEYEAAYAARVEGGLIVPYLHAEDDTRLFYKDVGSGAPIVALHSWSLSSAMWEYQLPTLVAAGHRVVALDRRGHGRSDVPGAGYDLDTLADDVHALIEALDLRDVTFLAHSMGTCEVVRYLTRHGAGRITRAVLVGAMTPHFAGAVGEEMVEAVVADLHTDRPAWFRTGVDAYFARPASGVSQALADDGVVTILATPLEVQTACMRTFTRTDLTDDLQAITIPVLVIHGDVDASAPLDITGRPTAALVPGARLEVYAGAPHGLYVTHRERLAADLATFIT